MRLKDLFTVPEKQKVTEKHLRRVLTPSICSILLCMSCLVSTTWAWFAVSIENTENVIQIATVTNTVTVTNLTDNTLVEPQNDGYVLQGGTYSIHIQINNDATGDDFANKKGPVYVLMSIVPSGVSRENSAAYYYFSFEGDTDTAEQTLEIQEESAVLSFTVTWLKPVGAEPVGSEVSVIGDEPTESSTEPSAETTEGTADPSEEATEPTKEADTTEETTASTESTESTVETTVPAEGADPTEETTTPTETTDPTETEPISTEATQETTAPETSTPADEA